MKDGNFVQNVGGQMDDDNFLLDIDEDISKDWEEINKKFKKEENEKIRKLKRERAMKHNRIDCPSFEEFYVTLYKIMESLDRHNNDNEINGELLYDFKHILRLIFHSGKRDNREYNEMPDSFRNIWEMYCSPNNYTYVYKPCLNCSKKYEIFYKQEKYMYTHIDEFFFGSVDDAIEIKESRVLCPNCGSILIRLNNCEFIGIVENYESP